MVMVGVSSMIPWRWRQTHHRSSDVGRRLAVLPADPPREERDGLPPLDQVVRPDVDRVVGGHLELGGRGGEGDRRVRGRRAGRGDVVAAHRSHGYAPGHHHHAGVEIDHVVLREIGQGTRRDHGGDGAIAVPGDLRIKVVAGRVVQDERPGLERAALFHVDERGLVVEDRGADRGPGAQTGGVGSPRWRRT